MVAHIDRRGLLSGGIGSGARFGQAKSAQYLTGGKPGQVFLLLFFCAEIVNANCNNKLDTPW
jgi:hypothetical protein